MLLYHFTSNVLLPKIEREGLTKGVVPWTLTESGKVRMMGGLQWLTADGDFFDQSWAPEVGLLGAVMRKTDWRIAIEIPNLAEFAVFTWHEFAEKHRLPVADYFRHFPGSQHWRIFQGKIPRSWFVERMKNPTHRQLVDIESN